nr:hypothetical protein [Clostridia bacterium]
MTTPVIHHRRRQTVNRKSATCAAIFAHFRQEKLPYTSKRPGGWFTNRPVRECNLAKIPEEFLRKRSLLRGFHQFLGVAVDHDLLFGGDDAHS